MKTLSRRRMLSRSAGSAAAFSSCSLFQALFAESRISTPTQKPRFKIGACDWSIGKLADVGAFDVAKQIGLDGVQVSLGTENNQMHLRRPEIQDIYRQAVKKTGVKVAALAIGELNRIPYKSDPRTIEWVSDSIDVCQAMACKVVLLAFFSKGDLKGDKKGTEEVVRRLKEVAPKAEKAGVIIGLESWLSAEEHIDIIQRVGSPAVQVYYDVANSNKMGYDIYEEIRWLGKQQQICEFHMKENGFLLGQGKVDFRKVRAAIDDIGYTGWMQIEGAIPRGQPMLESYRANEKYLRQMFSNDA